MLCCLPLQRYQDAPGVEHIPVVQIDLSVPLKVPGKCLTSLGNVGGIGTGSSLMARVAGDPEPSS